MDYTDVLRILRRPDAEVYGACRYGSRVYGTAGPASDEDFFVVLEDSKARRDLLFGAGANVVVHGLETFRQALADQSIFALECFFAPPEHRLKEGRPPLAFVLDRARLSASAIAKSEADFAKAARTFEAEPGPARKKLFQSLRVPFFARQLATQGKIVDFTEAAPLWTEIRDLEDATWEKLAKLHGPTRKELCEQLSRIGKKR